MKIRKFLIRMLTIAAIALPMAASAYEIRVGYTQDALTLDPANHRNRMTEGIIRNMYDGLTIRDDQMKVWPDLAESFTQVDKTTYVFKLHQGVKFHDGSVLTAEDVKYTFDRLTKEGAMGGQTSPRKSLLGPLVETTIVDKYTIRFKLANSWPVLPGMLPFQEVVSKAFVEKVGTEGMATKVNGTGPYKLVEWRQGDSVIMERFEDYFGGARGIPPVGLAKPDRIVFKVIPESASRVAALLAGEVDLINDLPVHAMKRVENNPNTKVLKTMGTRSFFVLLNNSKKPFNDVRVRHAINHAINKKLIIDRVLNGLATPIKGILSPQSFGHNPNLPEYEHNPAKAKALLAEAGYPDGVEVVLDTDHPFKDLAEAMASTLSKGGFKVKVQSWEKQAVRGMWKPKKPSERDMYFSSWGSGALDPSGIFFPVLRSNARGNRTYYSNAKVDQLLDAANSEANSAKRSKMYQDAQAIVTREAPLLFLWVPMDIYGANTRLQGWQPSGRGIIKLHDAYIE
jgi:peptide/nickel transport system substrate-binding protein